MWCRVPIVLAAVLLSTPVFSARPRDLSVAAFERFKQEAETEIKTTLEEEFREQTEAITKLSQPYSLGEVVTVTIAQGARQRRVSGRYRGIKGQYAQIGDRRYLLSDIVPSDRDRLHFGENKDLLQMKLDQLRRALEEKKAERAKVLRRQLYRRGGYTDEFFADSQQLGGRFWPRAALGHKTMQMTVTFSRQEPYVHAELHSGMPMSSGFLVLLDKTPAASNLTPDPEAPRFVEATWRKFAFRLDREGLGENVTAALSKRVKLWMMKDRVGSWVLKPYPRGKAVIVTRHQAACRECLGDGVVPGEDGGGEVPCPSCAGAGNVEVEPYDATKAEFTLVLVASRTRGYSGTQQRRFASYALAAARYQQRIVDKLAAVQEAAREARRAREREQQAKEEARRRQAAARAEQEARRQRIENAFMWLSPKKARDLAEADEVDKAFISTLKFDNVSFPETVVLDKHTLPIAKFTDWTKVRRNSARAEDRPFELFSLKYRFLKINLAAFEAAEHPPSAEEQEADDPVDPGRPAIDERGIAPDQRTETPPSPATAPNGAGRYFLQYQLNYMNNRTRAQHFIAQIVASFRDGAELKWEDKFFTAPSWTGSLFGTRELPLENLEKGVANVAIDGRAEAVK